MSEKFPGSMPTEEPKSVAPGFETIADALPEENREEFARLSEQVKDIADSHGGRIVDAELTSAERLLVDRHNELKALAFENIRMAE